MIDIMSFRVFILVRKYMNKIKKIKIAYYSKLFLMDLLFFFVSVQNLGFSICPYHNGKLFILCWVYAHMYKKIEYSWPK
jgi:hypothetical protein